MQIWAFKPSQSFCTGFQLYFDMYIVGVARFFICLKVIFNDDLFFTRYYFSSGTIDLARICQGNSYGYLILYFGSHFCTTVFILFHKMQVQSHSVIDIRNWEIFVIKITKIGYFLEQMWFFSYFCCLANWMP